MPSARPDLSSLSFLEQIESRSKSIDSRIVLSLDLEFRKDVESLSSDAIKIVKSVADYICAVKMNFHLIAPLSLNELKTLNSEVRSYDMPSIADVKLNDIDNTNRVATEYLWEAGFSAVIVNPFVGYEGGLDVVLKSAKELHKGVIALAYMSHKGAEEGYGLVLKDGRTIHELFLDRAVEWKVDGIIMGSTRPDKIQAAKKRLFGSNIKILSPGSGAQGADPLVSLAAGSDYVIVGRSILQSKEQRGEAKRLYESLLAWTKSH